MKKYLLLLAYGLPLQPSPDIQIQNPETIQTFPTVNQDIWVKKTVHLDDDYHEKLLEFLESMDNFFTELEKEKSDPILNSIAELIEHIRGQAAKVRHFMALEKTIGEQDEAFSLPQLVKRSTNSQGSIRVNTSAALQAISLDDEVLLKMIKQIDNSMKWSSADNVTEAVKELERFIATLEELQAIIMEQSPVDFRVLIEKVEEAKDEHESPKHVEAQALSGTDQGMWKQAESFWDSIVQAFKTHY